MAKICALALDTEEHYDFFLFFFFNKRQTSVSFIFWRTTLKLVEVKTKTNPGCPTNPPYFWIFKSFERCCKKYLLPESTDMEFSQRDFLCCIIFCCYVLSLRIRLLTVHRNFFQFHVSSWYDVCRWILMKEISNGEGFLSSWKDSNICSQGCNCTKLLLLLWVLLESSVLVHVWLVWFYK